MSEFLVSALRVGFLALMWLFILFAANVIRTDMFGRRVPAAASPEPTTTPVRRIRRSDPTRLVITEGRAAGAEIPLVGQIEVGRAHDATLPIDDDFASTHHARLWQLPSGEWRLEDLKSTNGTYVNEVRISAPITITPRDDVRIGRTHLRLEK